ncbi:MAG: GWxTD domain-containing protein [Bacteroidota bacterium]
MLRYRPGPYQAVVGVALLALVLSACAAPDLLDDPDAGRTLGFDPDALVFDLDARALLADSVAGLEALVAIAPHSLVFEETDAGTQEVRYQLAVAVRASDTGVLVREEVWTDTLRAPDAATARALPPVLHESRWALPPGTYLVEARLDDLGTQREGTRRLRLVVPSEGDGPLLGRLRVEVQRAERWVPHLGRTLAATDEALRVRIAARSVMLDGASATGAPMEAVLRVERLPSDTTVARPPHWLGPSRGSLAYQGVRMGAADTVFTSAPQPVEGRADLAFELPPLGPGLYRLHVVLAAGTPATTDASATGATPTSDAALIETERYLSVFAPGFPRLDTLDDLVETLAYIAYERELDFIRAGPTLDERRARFDGFWGTLIGDRRVAANLLRLYYERIEEANQRFSTVKPGWQTDRGLLYVLLGPPGYVQPELDGETWLYGNGLRQDAAAFRFRQATDFGQPPGWRPYLLDRQAAYEGVWATYVGRWRRGRVR